ncbi:DUF3592 domain-containing protein [Kosakonia sp. BK9b]|uniref:DUF3592 domain-containing protein n=1 Tax=Kosakonia sp. TaxID=1916651 RepID=UPI00289B4304|nr:DUF3592 domain-containing protein [Kosakonia sp.]
MNISYFTTYPLLFISAIALIFFIYGIIKASTNGVRIDPEDAIDTQGEIISIRSTSGENSAFINVVIQVKFTTRDNKTITSEGTSVIDVVKIPEYQKGAIVPLVYSKSDPKKIKFKIKSPLERR